MNLFYYKRLEADYLKKIEIWSLKKKGLLELGSMCSNRIISWKHGENEYTIGLEISLQTNINKSKEWKIKPSDIDKYVRFIYTQTDSEGNKKDFDYKVSLITTPCNLGGWRYWFECLFCKRRVGVLYLRGGYFACRHCQYLTYESKNLSGRWKRAGKIISYPELAALRKDIKRIFYNGKPTRKLKRYLHKKQKAKEIYCRNVRCLPDIM